MSLPLSTIRVARRLSLYFIPTVFLANQIRRNISFRTVNFGSNTASIFSSKLYFTSNHLTASLKMSSSSPSDFVVEHDPESKKFFIKLGADEAKLEYVKTGNVVNMWHTEVPPALQGKGIAKILAQEAFDYVVKENLKMLLTCTYLQKYYKDNPKPEYTSHVV